MADREENSQCIIRLPHMLDLSLAGHKQLSTWTTNITSKLHVSHLNIMLTGQIVIPGKKDVAFNETNGCMLQLYCLQSSWLDLLFLKQDYFYNLYIMLHKYHITVEVFLFHIFRRIALLLCIHKIYKCIFYLITIFHISDFHKMDIMYIL